MKFSQKQKRGLQLLCNHIIGSQVRKDDPNQYWKRKASDLKVVEHFEELLPILPKNQQKELSRFASLLNSRLLGLTWNGLLLPIQQLNKKQIATMLDRWSRSSLNSIRKAHSAIIKLTCYYYYVSLNGSNANPNWKSMQYKGDLGYKPVSHSAIKPIQVTENIDLEVDYLIIGSGSGGGVVANELIQRNKAVLLVEKGPFKMPMHMNHFEEDMHNTLYEQRALLNSNNGGVTILAGSCFGGGSTINWAGSLRTPDYVLEEWAKKFNNPHFLESSFQEGFDFIERKTSVQKSIDRHNPQNEILWQAGVASNLKPSIIPRNVKINDQLNEHWQWHGQGYSSLGNSFRIKQSTAVSFLEGAAQDGLQILCDTEIEKLNIEQGKVTGASGIHKNGSRVHIKANTVVVAAGSLHTPAILMRSGIRHTQLGKNLHLHPAVVTSAMYDQKIEAWYGPMMSTLINDFHNLDHEHHGFKIETAPFHPGFASVILPWKNAIQFKTDMAELAKVAHFVTLVRDKHSGQIKLNKAGKPIVHYVPHSHDLNHSKRGIAESFKLHAKGGAKKIFHPHQHAKIYHSEKESLNAYFEETKKLKWKPNQYRIGSAHQMGTCRMSGDRKLGVVKPSGELWDIKNLFIADASLFPSASGANPMLSIQALALHVSKNIP